MTRKVNQVFQLNPYLCTPKIKGLDAKESRFLYLGL